MTSGRNNPRKLPVVLQIRQMADKRTSAKISSVVGFFNARTLTTLAALPFVTLAVYVGWQLAGQPTDNALLLPSETPVVADSDPVGTDSPKVSSSVMSSVTAATYETKDQPWQGPDLAGTPSPQVANGAGQNIHIHSVVPMPPEQVKEAGRERTIMR